MPTFSILFAEIAALIHVLFFLVESIFWMQPKVHRVFGVKNIQEAELFKISFFNQGFYNLFLAIGVFVGMYFIHSENIIIGKTLLLFCCASMLSAAIVLFLSKPKLIIGALVQGLCPLISILAFLFLK